MQTCPYPADLAGGVAARILYGQVPVVWALHRMGVDGYRHLPVMEDERLVGFLSIRTVLQVFRDA